MRPRSNQAKRLTLFRPSKGLRQVFKDAPVTQDLVRHGARVVAELGKDPVLILPVLLRHSRQSIGSSHDGPPNQDCTASMSCRASSTRTAAPRAAPGDIATVPLLCSPDALVAELRGVIADLRADRDHWRDHQAQRLALPAPRRPWWRWMRATG
jgi:hypothetical protein